MDHGLAVTVLDNPWTICPPDTGHRQAVNNADLLHADLLDSSSLERVFATRRFDAVLHFCARSLAGGSVVHPYDYYANNVAGTLNLLQVMRRHEVKRLIFSSTAALFGQPLADRIDEEHPQVPINPYGASKLVRAHS